MPNHIDIATLVRWLDLAGTAVFAVSGAAIGVKHGLDVFGVCVLAFVTGNAGGMLRDVLIGSVPPTALAGWQYVTVSLFAGMITFLWHPRLERLHRPILIFDAAGLALFSVSGAQKALAFGLDPMIAAMLGMLTGIGGGMLRDVLVGEIPTVLRKDLYALAALAGAAAVVAGQMLHLPPTAVAMAGAALCFLLRVAAIERGWDLPRSGPAS
jgi:uncharacterized membrane protein YeiH